MNKEAQLMKTCITRIKAARELMHRADIGSLRYSEAMGREFAFMLVAETLATWSNELEQLYDESEDN